MDPALILAGQHHYKSLSCLKSLQPHQWLALIDNNTYLSRSCLCSSCGGTTRKQTRKWESSASGVTCPAASFNDLTLFASPAPPSSFALVHTLPWDAAAADAGDDRLQRPTWDTYNPTVSLWVPFFTLSPSFLLSLSLDTTPFAFLFHFSSPPAVSFPLCVYFLSSRWRMIRSVRVEWCQMWIYGLWFKFG